MLIFRIFPLLLLCLLNPAAKGEEVNSHKEAYEVLERRGEVYFRFGLDEPEQVKDFSRIISIDYYHPASGFVYAYANLPEFQWFAEQEISYEVLTAPSLSIDKNQINMVSSVDVDNINSWNFYPTYPAYESMMSQFEELFPDLYQRVEILTLASGRKLIFGRITSNVSEDHDKPRFLYTSTIHGDEVTGFNLSLRLIHYLLNNYGENESVTHLLDNLEIWICPNENPDGTYTTNNTTVVGATRGNVSFVDMNRNYPNPVSNPESFMQPETEAMIDLVQNYDFVMSANMHGGIECVNYPWDSWTSTEKTHADHDWWQLVMHEYADTARYYSPYGYMDPWGSSFYNGVTHGGDWYVVYGSRQDYLNYYVNTREFTLELSNIKLLPTDLLEDHWEYNYRSMLNYMKQSLYGIRGRVTDINTGEPILAEISIPGHDMDNSHVWSSADHGGYSRPLLAGTYTLEFKADGYPAKTLNNVSVNNYETTWLNVEMGIFLSADSPQLSDPELLYPNPAGEKVSVMNFPEADMMLIFDMHGRLIMEHDLSESQAGIPVAHLKPGIYLVQVYSRHAVLQQKFLKK